MSHATPCHIAHVVSCRTVPSPHQFQQLLKPDKEASAPAAAAPGSAEVAAKDGGFEPITTRVSPAGAGVRADKGEKEGREAAGRPPEP